MHVYFSGIGGVGIGPLAMLALDCGFMVSGSDLQQTEMVSYLRDRGARVHIGQSGAEIAEEHITQPIDWFVYSSALPVDHPELKFAKEHDIKFSKRSEFLNHLLHEQNQRLIAISGTHGKTTTTALLVWMFKQLGLPVSYSIGSTISFGRPAEFVQQSEFFVYECDEFDKNFLDFKPSVAVIPSIDYDHADTYPTQADYDYAFNEFISNSQKVLLWQQVADHLKLKDQTNFEILSEIDPGRSAIKLAGEHMRRNAWLAIQTIHKLYPTIEIDRLVQAASSFPGASRRFERLAENVYTDYAHHPVEIAATIELAKEINQNVVLVYQPHQNIRQHELVENGGYDNCFNGAKKIYWLPTYLSREYQDLPILSPDQLISSVKTDVEIEAVELNDDLLEKIKTHQKNGDLVVAMSAGDLDTWLRNQVLS